MNQIKPISWFQLVENVKLIVENIDEPSQIVLHKDDLMKKLDQYTSEEQDFKQFVNYDEKGFTKNLVTDFGHICNIIVMCWAPGQMSSIHSHNGSKCFVKILKGQLNEARFGCPSKLNPVVQVDLLSGQESTLNKNDVTYIDDSIGTHKVTNKSSQVPAVSLHIYVPAYKTSRVYTPIKSDNGKTSLSFEQCRAVDLDFYNTTLNNGF